MQITTLKRGEPDFYQLLGPIFGSRSYEKEVGIRSYDDAGKIWFAALEHGKVIGLASIHKSLVSDCYVLPEHRLKGVFTAVLHRLLEKTEGNLRATCTAASEKGFKRAGFIETSALKNFKRLELIRA